MFRINKTKIKVTVFIPWILQYLFVEYISFDQEHWRKVTTKLELFFKTYVYLALLNVKPVTFYIKYNQFLPGDNEIDNSKERKLSSIRYDIYSA